MQRQSRFKLSAAEISLQSKRMRRFKKDVAKYFRAANSNKGVLLIFFVCKCFEVVKMQAIDFRDAKYSKKAKKEH